MLAVLDDVIDTFGWWALPLAPVLLVAGLIGFALTAVLSSRRSAP